MVARAGVAVVEVSISIGGDVGTQLRSGELRAVVWQRRRR
jgi:hypothetical protein